MPDRELSVSPSVPDPASGGRPGFNLLLQRLAGIVSIVTVGRGGATFGTVVTTVSSLGTEPPRLLLTMDRSSASFAAIAAELRFGINILGAGQEEVADRFAAGRQGASGAFRGLAWHPGNSGVPLLEGAVATVECEVDDIDARYARAVLIGRPLAIVASTEVSALAYWNGDYVRLLHDRDLDRLAEVSLPPRNMTVRVAAAAPRRL